MKECYFRNAHTFWLNLKKKRIIKRCRRSAPLRNYSFRYLTTCSKKILGLSETPLNWEPRAANFFHVGFNDNRKIYQTGMEAVCKSHMFSSEFCVLGAVTISLLVTRLLSSSHAPQWSGRAWIASTNTSTASLSRSSLRSTTPYLRGRRHKHRSTIWNVHSAEEEEAAPAGSSVLTGIGWSRPALLPCASYWAPPSALVKLRCEPDPFLEDLPSHEDQKWFNRTGNMLSLVWWEKAKQSNSYPSCPPFHHLSFSHLTIKTKYYYFLYLWYCKLIKM